MTVPPTNKNESGGGRLPQPTNRFDSTSTLDPFENFDDESKKRRLPSRRRMLPSWVKEQLPLWGEERLCLPEWDDDENIDDEEEVVGDRDDCGEGEIDGYRSKNGWKVRRAERCDVCRNILCTVDSLVYSRCLPFGIIYIRGQIYVTTETRQ